MGTHFGARPEEIADEIAQRSDQSYTTYTVSYTHLRAHETLRYLVCRRMR